MELAEGMLSVELVDVVDG
jgi:hypothetical protein